MKPKILLYDLETAPNLGYVWGKYDQRVLSYVDEGRILCFAYKWLGSKEVHCLSMKGHPNDYGVVMALRILFNQADVIVAHNGDEFDYKKATARMLYHNMVPPKIPAQVDTKKVAKAYFEFNGNGLDDLGQYLKLGKKQKHSGFDMWLGCMKNDSKAWREMIKYNKQDVLLLEKVYNRMLPWMRSHPNLGKLINPVDRANNVCHTCGSNDVIKKGFRATAASVQQQWQCKKCGSWFLSRLQQDKTCLQQVRTRLTKEKK